MMNSLKGIAVAFVYLIATACLLSSKHAEAEAMSTNQQAAIVCLYSNDPILAWGCQLTANLLSSVYPNLARFENTSDFATIAAGLSRDGRNTLIALDGHGYNAAGGFMLSTAASGGAIAIHVKSLIGYLIDQGINVTDVSINACHAGSVVDEIQRAYPWVNVITASHDHETATGTAAGIPLGQMGNPAMCYYQILSDSVPHNAIEEMRCEDLRARCDNGEIPGVLTSAELTRCVENCARVSTDTEPYLGCFNAPTLTNQQHTFSAEGKNFAQFVEEIRRFIENLENEPDVCPSEYGVGTTPNPEIQNFPTSIPCHALFKYKCARRNVNGTYTSIDIAEPFLTESQCYSEWNDDVMQSVFWGDPETEYGADLHAKYKDLANCPADKPLLWLYWPPDVEPAEDFVLRYDVKRSLDHASTAVVSGTTITLGCEDRGRWCTDMGGTYQTVGDVCFCPMTMQPIGRGETCLFAPSPAPSTTPIPAPSTNPCASSTSPQ